MFKPRFRIIFEIIRVVEAETYEEAIQKTFPNDSFYGFIRVVDVSKI
jgi:hypothetical protein